MKIALALEYSIDQFGGTEVLVRELIQGLAKRHQLTLVSPDDATAIKNSSIGAGLDGHVTWKPEELSAAKSQELAETLKQRGVQLAHFHFGGNYAWGNRYFSQCPILFVHRAGIPCISTNHGAFAITDGYCGPHRTFLKWALLPAAWVNKLHVLSYLKTEIAVSQHDYHALRRWYWPLRSRFGQIYHSRIHENAPPPPGPRKPVIICLGTIGLRKGQTYLVEAFSRISEKFPAWQLVLIGRPAEKSMADEINAMIARNQQAGKILLLNERSNEEVKEWLRMAAIFAMPSVAEGLGLSLQEALFNGCACIGSAVGGITDLIEDGSNGILVEPRNVQQLAEGLQTLMADEHLREHFGARGAQSIVEKEMLAEKMVGKYDQLYRGILMRA